MICPKPIENQDLKLVLKILKNQVTKSTVNSKLISFSPKEVRNMESEEQIISLEREIYCIYKTSSYTFASKELKCMDFQEIPFFFSFLLVTNPAHLVKMLLLFLSS